MKIAIIGAGASGLFLGVKLNKYDVTIYEKSSKIASKLLASGNGKCNLLNINAKSSDYNNEVFMEEVFKFVKPKEILDEFHKLGLLTINDDEGRCYPRALSSQTVLNILLDNIRAKILLDTPVLKITKVKDKYKINDENVLYDYCIIASGSKASLIQKNSSFVYDYIKNLKINITPLKPSLVGFKVKNNIKKLNGFRTKSVVSLYDKNNRLIHKEYGEVIFKENGISGIVVMNMSSYYQREKMTEGILSLDLIPDIQGEPENIKGALHPTLYKYLCDNNLEFSDLKTFKLEIENTYDTSLGQVVSGGIDLEEINNNFELKKYKNIYASGEVLDIDGLCGGYNLLFSFTSALIISNDIKRKENI